MTPSATRRAACLAALAFLAMAGPGSLEAYDPKSTAAVNVDRTGLALRGYDPVAYFARGQPVPGRPEFQSTFDGATYRFESADAKAAFDNAPAKYAPQYGGFCAWAAANGYKADADPKAWSVVGGRLYVNYDATVAKTWSTSTDRYIKQGDAAWPKVKGLPPK
jgi:YHS domain-containing protein